MTYVKELLAVIAELETIETQIAQLESRRDELKALYNKALGRDS